jgi:broad specificity phosphatase PhoE
VSVLYLIRHGQAGSRDDYDRLGDLGREQATRLGDWLRASGIDFRTAITGGLRRQRETAEAVLGRQADIVDERRNEFNLDHLWEHLAPELRAADPQFSADYDLHHAENTDRRWTPCDVALVRAWTRGAAPGGIESWPAFHARVLSMRAEYEQRFGSGEAIAVFTSATPAAIWCGEALGIDATRTFHLAGVMWNSAFSTIRVRPGELALYSLNNAPHLTEPRLRTFR